AKTWAGERQRTKPPGRAGPGGFCYAPEAGGSRLVDQEGAWQRNGARPRQVGRGIHRAVTRGRDAEHRGERGGRRGASADGPRRRAALVDRAAGRAAGAADLSRHLASAEEAARIGFARGAGGERREIDRDHADVRAVTAVAAPGRAGAGVGSARGVAWGRTGRRGIADAARRAVARDARRAGGGAG